MKRRDFLKLCSAGAAGLALPAALIAPALGGGWQDFRVLTYFGEPKPDKAFLVRYHLDCFKRHMIDKGLTEIAGYSYETSIRRDPDDIVADLHQVDSKLVWVVDAQAKLR